MSDRQRDTGRFQFNQTITLGLLITLLIETTGALLWVGGASARLGLLELQMNSHIEVSERLARLEGETSQMATSLSRIERELLRDHNP